MARGNTEELVAVYSGSRHEKNGFFVGTATTSDGRRVTVKGNYTIPPELGVTYRFLGRQESHATYGNQFNVQSYVESTPAGERGITRYLSQCQGIGPAIANRIWTAFGEASLSTLRTDPQAVVVAVRGLTPAVAEKAAADLAKKSAMEGTVVALTGLLSGTGVPKSIYPELIEKLGTGAAKKLESNPYLLMHFRGCGFGRADQLYLSLNYPADRLKRQTLCIWHSLMTDQDGHVWHSADAVVKTLQSRIAGASVRVADAVKLGVKAGYLRTRRDHENKLWIASEQYAEEEAAIAELVADMLVDDDPRWGWGRVLAREESLRVLTDHQRVEAAKLRGRLAILTGSPGTGKSFSTATLVRAALQVYRPDEIGVAAPTGKAAVRLTELMDQWKLPVKGCTVHRLLAYGPDESGRMGFQYNARTKMPFKVIIGDEWSMADNELTLALLEAVDDGAYVLFVGDIHQLPPVGHGSPLRDMIAAGVPCGRLVEIKRNAGTIVRACRDIREIGEGRRTEFEVAPKMAPYADPPANLVHVAAVRDTAPKTVLELIRQLKRCSVPVVEGKDEHLEDPKTPGRRPIDPIWDVTIGVAVNRNSTLSREALNGVLQAELNEGGEPIEGTGYRVGDKVMCLKNGALPQATIEPKAAKSRRVAKKWSGVDGGEEDSSDPTEPADQPHYIANGDVGKVIRGQGRRLVVEFYHPTRVVFVPVPMKGEKDEQSDDHEQAGGSAGGRPDGSGKGLLTLAYAQTIHKMQGSETPFIIVCLDEYPGATGQFGLCTRNWLTTAISRARYGCYLVGRMPVALRVCQKDAIGLRKTFLKELIQEEMGPVGGMSVASTPAAGSASTASTAATAVSTTAVANEEPALF